MVRARNYADEVYTRVGEMVDEGCGYVTIALELGLPRYTVRTWVDKHRRLVGLGTVTAYQTYSPELKLAAVRQFLSGATKAEVLDEFRIRNKSQLERWITIYREDGEDAFREARTRSAVGAGPESIEQKLLRLEMENAALKKLQALVAEERRQR